MSRPLSKHEEESRRKFAEYYDAKWLPKDWYFSFHRTRFLQSFEILDPFVKRGSVVADLVQPGDGPGPLADFFGIQKQAAITLITGDLRERFDVDDATCDFVICTETIEHIKDKDSTRITDLERFNYSGVDNMLSECARILREDGQLFITTPNSSSFANLYKWLMGQLPYMAEHVREYTVDLLNEVCGRNGFNPVLVELRDAWRLCSENVMAQLEKLLEASPVKRNMSRAENIYALYRKGSGTLDPERIR